ncbi:MAG: 16S rRNA (guanine(966)-N(2))-methyltransferase RsmD [Candidatus Izemoplasmatales bacterium]|jgi:16S rRNA (guanine966-N2)-methyltransferase
MLRIISGIRKGALIAEVDRRHTRPTTDKNKEMLFNILGQYFDGGNCLDLFAGSGSLGLEALSRGFSACTFVDNNPTATATIRKNLDKLRFPDEIKAAVILDDVFSYLGSVKANFFDLIMADPPYLFQDHERLLRVIIDNGLIAGNGLTVIETSRKKELPEQLGELFLFKDKISGLSRFWFYSFVSNPID